MSTPKLYVYARIASCVVTLFTRPDYLYHLHVADSSHNVLITNFPLQMWFSPSLAALKVGNPACEPQYSTKYSLYNTIPSIWMFCILHVQDPYFRNASCIQENTPPIAMYFPYYWHTVRSQVSQQNQNSTYQGCFFLFLKQLNLALAYWKFG